MDLEAFKQNLKSFFSPLSPKGKKKSQKGKKTFKLPLLFRTEESSLIQIV